jgi:hypothetical protein
MGFFDNPSGNYDPSLLMALVSKQKLINYMLKRGKDQKLFRVYRAMVELIINKMIEQHIIVDTGGDLLASPMRLLESIVKNSIPGPLGTSNTRAASYISGNVCEHSTKKLSGE